MASFHPRHTVLCNSEARKLAWPSTSHNPVSDPQKCTLVEPKGFAANHDFANMVSNAGISVWASQKEKTSLGPVIRSCTMLAFCATSSFHTACLHALGTRPLKKLEKPSFLAILDNI